MELRCITAEELIGEIRKKYKKHCIAALVILIFGILVSAFFYMVAIGAGILLTAFLVLIPLAYILYTRSKLKNIENIRVFRCYGTPDELASLIRNGSDGVLHQGKNLLLTKQFMMNPNDLESIIPLTCVQLAYIHTESYNGIPTSQTMKVHDIYNYTIEFSFKIGKKGREEIVGILTEIGNAAPWITLGYSPANVRAAAKNKIKPGDPRPIRQLPDQIGAAAQQQQGAPVYPQQQSGYNPNSGNGGFPQ